MSEGLGLNCNIGLDETLKPDGCRACKDHPEQHLCPNSDVRGQGVLGTKRQGVVEQPVSSKQAVNENQDGGDAFTTAPIGCNGQQPNARHGQPSKVDRLTRHPCRKPGIKGNVFSVMTEMDEARQRIEREQYWHWDSRVKAVNWLRF